LLEALKIRSQAVTSSFRYPRVQVGRLPTFDMPPPATIYGHLAGVLGRWFEPGPLAFSYVFEHDGKADDVETAHPIEAGSGKLGLKKRGWNFPINVECSPNPQRREFLLRPRMTLYLTGDAQTLRSFEESFRSPEWAYILGRSQDLATVRSVDRVQLEDAPEAAFSNTLLPFEWRPYVMLGTSVLLPAAVDYRENRQARQERYLQITSPPLAVYEGSKDTISRQALPEQFCVDTSEHLTVGGRALMRGIIFLPVQSR
jgi:CRISPR-associated protein Cas5t